MVSRRPGPEHAATRRGNPPALDPTARTLAPCEIRRWVMAVPRSPVAPVTMIFLPLNDIICSFSRKWGQRVAGVEIMVNRRRSMSPSTRGGAASSPPLHQANDGLDRAAIFTVMRSLIDLIEAVKLDQFFEWEATLRVEFDELRDKNVWNALTLKNAAYPLARYHQVVHVKAHLSAQWLCSDDAARAERSECVYGLM